MEIISARPKPAVPGTPFGKCRKWRLWVNTREAGMKNRRFNGTYSMAKKACDEFAAELAGSIPNDDSFISYAKRRVRQRVDSGTLSPNTAAKEQRALNAIERSPMAPIRMDAIGPQDCRDALSWIRVNPQRPHLTKSGVLSNTTMQGIYEFVRETFQQAVDDELLARNPMGKIKDPKKDTEKVKALPWRELMELLDWLDKKPLSGYVMAMYAIVCFALRRAEACAVFDEKVTKELLFVTHAVKERNGTLGPPKSEAGKRKFLMVPRFWTKACQWRAHRAEKGLADALTFACNVQGGVLRPQNLWRWWKKETAGTKWEDVGLHQLRHSTLTRIGRHMSAYDLMDYAGWSSLEPTRIYIHDDFAMVARGTCEAWGIPYESRLRLVA